MYGAATFYGSIPAENMYATAQFDDDELNAIADPHHDNEDDAVAGSPSIGDSCAPISAVLESSSEDDEFDDFSDDDDDNNSGTAGSSHSNDRAEEATPTVSPFPTPSTNYGIIGDSHDNLYISTPDYDAPPPPIAAALTAAVDANTAYSAFHEEESTDELPIEKPDVFRKAHHHHRKRTNSRIVVQKPSVISGGGGRRQVHAISEWKDARVPLSIGSRASSGSIAVRLRTTGENVLGTTAATPNSPPTSPQTQAGTQLTRDWNSDFQEILDIPNDSPEKLGRLTKLAQEFTSMAVTYATIIITELCLPNDLKTVRPADMGGTAGGQKFVVQGILFKIALDVQLGPGMYMYGDKEPRNEFAMKAAAKELNGLGALWASANVEGICGPLMTIVDYKGFRIVAMSLLPIGKDTIRYGSADGGITVHADDPFLNKQLKAFAKPYHLKKHLVGKDLAARALYLPGDIEGHHGYDDRYYLLDFARLMPPEGPSTDPKARDKHKRAVFYRTLRPEFLRFQVKKPLCSDAFTFFDSSSKSQQARHRRDIMEATNFLYTVVIPDYTKSLEQRLEKVLQERGGFDTVCNNNMDAAEILMLTTGTHLHPRGLNIRHLGRVRKASSNPTARKLVLSAICARLVKNIINKRMRDTMNQVRAPADAPFEEDIVQVFNLLLGTSKASTWFWQEELLPEIEDSFPEALSDDERTDDFKLVSAVDLRLIFIAVLNLMNISLSPQASDDLFLFLRLNDHSQEFQFVVGDITQLGMRLRTLPVVYFCEAMQTFQRVSPTMNISTKMRILLRAEQAFTKTILTIPFCPIITNQFAKLYLYMADLSAGPARDRYYANAFQKFSTTIFDLGYEFHESLELWSAALRKYAKEEREFGREEHAKQLEADAVDVESRFEKAWGKKGECNSLFRGIAAAAKPAVAGDPEAGAIVE